MAIRVIDDTKLQNIAVAIQSKDNGGQMAVDEMPGRIEAIPTDEQLKKICDGTAKYIKISVPSVVNRYILPSHNISCVYFSVKNRNDDYYVARSFFGFGKNTINKTLVNLDNVLDMADGLFFNAKVSTLILNTSSVNRLAGNLQMEDNENIYVKDSLVSGYKSASNWSRYGDQLKGFSEAPYYDNSTVFQIGDVCSYNNKFYSYFREDLQPSSGHSPTGTNEDNDYWEYVADIEVI